MPVVYSIFSLEVYKRHGKTTLPVSLELSMKEAKAAWVLFLFLLAAMKKDYYSVVLEGQLGSNCHLYCVRSHCMQGRDKITPYK